MAGSLVLLGRPDVVVVGNGVGAKNVVPPPPNVRLLLDFADGDGDDDDGPPVLANPLPADDTDSGYFAHAGEYVTDRATGDFEIGCVSKPRFEDRTYPSLSRSFTFAPPKKGANAPPD